MTIHSRHRYMAVMTYQWEGISKRQFLYHQARLWRLEMSQYADTLSHAIVNHFIAQAPVWN